MTDFKAIFHPRSIAVIGASSDSTKFGGRAYLSVRDRCDRERVYPVNPKVSEIDGVKSYANIKEIPDDIDFAIVTVPAPHAVQAVQDCATKKIPVVEILTAGFSETGSYEGVEWENRIRKTSRQNGIRIIGPNCFGVYSPESALTILPGSDFPRQSGDIGFMAQSGGFTNILVRKLSELGMQVSKAVSYGNACDLNEIDFLSYFQHDEQTRIITAYIEGVKDGRRFFKVAKEAALIKPVVVWKGGLTYQGSRAVSSHTASLGGSKRLWDGFFRQTGVISATDGNEMLDLIIGLKCLPNFLGKRMSVVGGGGAITVAASDALERAELSILPFSSDIQKALRAHLPPHGNSVNNPVDVGSPIYGPEMIHPILEIVAGAETVDAVIVEQMIIKFSGEFDEGLAQVIQTVRQSTGKPFIVTLPQTSFGSDALETEKTRRKYREWYLDRRIPVFDSSAHAANVLRKIARYNEYLKFRDS